MGMGGEESMAGLSLIGVVVGLGWARLGKSELGSALLVGAGGVVCVNVRGRVRDRGNPQCEVSEELSSWVRDRA